jgi:hypothetical protein
MYSVRFGKGREEGAMLIKRITPEEADALGIPRVTTVISGVPVRKSEKSPPSKPATPSSTAGHPAAREASTTGDHKK